MVGPIKLAPFYWPYFQSFAGEEDIDFSAKLDNCSKRISIQKSLFTNSIKQLGRGYSDKQDAIFLHPV